MAKASSKKAISGFSSEQLLSFYKDMLRVRRFEEKAGQLYGMGLIGGYCHLYIGQEAVVCGIQSSLADNDSSVTGYRLHGHLLSCGADPNIIMAELTGRQGGISGGKGGSMHMFWPEKGFYGGHGIVGAQVPIGAGVAFAHRYRKDGGVCATYFGDGAANQGQVSETMNMAALWGLPLLLVIENNQYGMGTATKRIAAGGSLAHRGDAFGIKNGCVDGMDVIAVAQAAQKAIEYCRKNQAPFVLEAMTYRYRGHSMSDPAKYRTRDEVQHVREERDAITKLKTLLLAENIVDEGTLKKIDHDCKEIASQAAEFARTNPEPDTDSLLKNIYAGDV